MDGVLAELSLKKAISEDLVDNLRSHISLKGNYNSQQEKAVIFADAVNRILDRHLPAIGSQYIDSIKRAVFLEAAKKNSFSIDYLDIFKASMELKLIGNVFVKEMLKWLSDSLQREINREQFFNFILKVYKAQVTNPGCNIESIIEEVRKEVDILPEKETSILVNGINTEQAASIPVNGINTEQAASILVNDFNTEQTAVLEDEVVLTYYERENKPDQETDLEKTLPDSSGDIFKSRLAGKSYKSIFSNIIFQNSLARLNLRRIISLFIATGFSLSVGFGLFIQGEDLNSIDKTNSQTNVIIHSIPGSDTLKSESKKIKTENNNKTIKEDNIPIPSENKISRSGFERNNTNIAEIKNTDQNQKLKKAVNSKTNVIKKMKATAYDLSVQSCGKLPGNPGYGITYSGTRVQTGRTVAVDPNVIPIGSRLYITFPDKYKELNGTYIAEDTGSRVKGNVIDVFLGEDQSGSSEIKDRVKQFGVQRVYVKILVD